MIAMFFAQKVGQSSVTGKFRRSWKRRKDIGRWLDSSICTYLSTAPSLGFRAEPVRGNSCDQPVCQTHGRQLFDLLVFQSKAQRRGSKKHSILTQQRCSERQSIVGLEQWLREGIR